jgi:hypothetical protein
MTGVLRRRREDTKRRTMVNMEANNAVMCQQAKDIKDCQSHQKLWRAPEGTNPDGTLI